MLRIGEFSRQNGTTVHTIRHYVDLGLLIPQKKGIYYYFDDRCTEELKEIQWLKEHDFSLAVIQKLLVTRRVAQLEKAADMDYYRRFFQVKLDDLAKERRRLDKTIADVAQRVQSLNVPANKKNVRRLGVPLTMLTVLVCPRCGGSFRLAAAQIVDEMILEADLACDCPESEFSIEAGILLHTSEKMQCMNVTRDDSMRDYIEQVAPEFINLICEAAEWMISRAQQASEATPLILEPGTGSGMFLRHFSSRLPAGASYVAVDQDWELLLYTKRCMEEAQCQVPMVFACCDFHHLPVRDESVDWVVDYFGSSNFNFKATEFLPSLLAHKVKPRGTWYGAFFDLDLPSNTLQRYPAENRRYFQLQGLEQLFRQSNFQIMDSNRLGAVSHAGPPESFFQEGDKLWVWACYGKKASG